MIPVPNFTFAKDGLVVTFTDLSFYNPTSWLWDFGNGETSTDKNPLANYSSGGFFVVTLVVTNGDGTSPIPQSISIGISSTNTEVGNISIFESSKQQIPFPLRSGIDNNELFTLISFWQRYLYPIIPPNIVKPEDVVNVLNELMYDVRINDLISKLIAYEYIIASANDNISTANNGDIEDTLSTDEGTVKKIETGPATVEFYESPTADNMTAAAAAISAASKPGGTLDQMKSLICQMSEKLRIYLPICGQLNHQSVGFVKTDNPHNRTSLPITSDITDIKSTG